jgi:cobalt-zinc-cadmium resistance protein CzcA
VDAIGGYVKQYQVPPDPAKLIAYGLSFAQVAKAIEANNLSRGASVIERNGEGITVRTGGRLGRRASGRRLAGRRARSRQRRGPRGHRR